MLITVTLNRKLVEVLMLYFENILSVINLCVRYCASTVNTGSQTVVNIVRSKYISRLLYLKMQQYISKLFR